MSLIQEALKRKQEDTGQAIPSAVPSTTVESPKSLPPGRNRKGVMVIVVVVVGVGVLTGMMLKMRRPITVAGR